jgi:hypothetical protein
MRISHVLAIAATAAATLSAATPAFAAPSVPAAQPNTVTVQATSQSRKLSLDEAAGMDGVFQLDDGRLLTVTHRYSKVYARFDGKREELVPAGPNRFVSRDTGARLTFSQVPYGEEVVLNQAAH